MAKAIRLLRMILPSLKSQSILQSEESPHFDDIFVMFGAFHVMLNVYSSTGEILEGSGRPYVLSEAKIVAPGSINQFLKRKM